MTEKILYRAVSKKEFKDWRSNGKFRCSRNTLECKQFFESEVAGKNFVNLATERQFEPPYIYILKVTLDKTALDIIKYDIQVLDNYQAISIAESDLELFNECLKKVEKI